MASARPATCSFVKIADVWLPTFLAHRPRRPAMAALVRPPATRSSTSRSRGPSSVNAGCAAGRGGEVSQADAAQQHPDIAGDRGRLPVGVRIVVSWSADHDQGIDRFAVVWDRHLQPHGTRRAAGGYAVRGAWPRPRRDGRCRACGPDLDLVRAEAGGEEPGRSSRTVGRLDARQAQHAHRRLEVEAEHRPGMCPGRPSRRSGRGQRGSALAPVAENRIEAPWIRRSGEFAGSGWSRMAARPRIGSELGVNTRRSARLTLSALVGSFSRSGRPLW